MQDEHTLKVEDGGGWVPVPAEMLGVLTPNALALHLALMIHGYAEPCWPGAERLTALTQLGEKPIRVAKNELINHGLLDEKRRGQGKTNLYTVRSWGERDRSRAVESTALEPRFGRREVEEVEVGVGFRGGPSSKDSKPNTFLSFDENEVAAPRAGARERRQKVFDQWIEITGRTGRTLLDPKRLKLIDRALRSYPLEDVLDAVRGWRHSPHHCGQNDTGTVYNDLSLLLRDGSNIERFRDLERNPQRLPANGRVTTMDDYQALKGTLG